MSKEKEYHVILDRVRAGLHSNEQASERVNRIRQIVQSQALNELKEELDEISGHLEFVANEEPLNQKHLLLKNAQKLKDLIKSKLYKDELQHKSIEDFKAGAEWAKKNNY